jgi:starvation-inducible outer membrane lipoprotein
MITKPNKMKKIIYFLAILSLTACNTKPKPVQDYSLTPNGLAGLQNTATVASTTTAAGQNNLILNPKHGEPGHDCSIAVGAPLKTAANQSANTAPTTVSPQVTTVPAPVQQTAATVNTAGKILNPAHGQPNHRCDIAVGAPLDSKPIKDVSINAKPQVQVSPTTAPATTQIPLLNEKGQRLNPAHGQPGHKCEIAVGAPLT